MKALYYIVRCILIVALLTVFPYWAATALDLNLTAFLVTFYFIALLLFAGARDVKGKNIASFRNKRPSKILFPFPFYDDEF